MIFYKKHFVFYFFIQNIIILPDINLIYCVHYVRKYNEYFCKHSFPSFTLSSNCMYRGANAFYWLLFVWKCSYDLCRWSTKIWNMLNINVRILTISGSRNLWKAAIYGTRIWHVEDFDYLSYSCLYFMTSLFKDI